MRIREVIVGLTIGALLSGCSLLVGDERVEESCQTLNDGASLVPGVSRAGWQMVSPAGMPTCAGSVGLDGSLSAAEQGRAVGTVYDLVRTSGQAVAISTTISAGDVVLRVRSGFPSAATATGMLELMARAGSTEGELLGGSGFSATVKAHLSSTSPGASLREGVALMSIAAPEGVRRISWIFEATTIQSPSVDADVADRLNGLAAWFDDHPVVISFGMRKESSSVWDLTTAVEVPDDVRAFADLAALVWADTVTVTARVPGKAPYVTVP